MNILVTGGAGYIGSHTVIELVDQNHTVVVDDLSNSSEEVINRIEKITGTRPEFHKFNLENREKLEALFEANNFDAVIHFAGLKAVGESVEQPLRYYRTNLDSTLTLLETMEKFGVKKFVFSSSATVYGDPTELPLKETSQTGIGLTNPYGQTKFMIEQIIRDYALAQPDFSAVILRYFNPIGAHKSGLIGEAPQGRPNNLLPYVTQVAVGNLPSVGVFGNDYDTPDGTGIRDYIHVSDLAAGHVAALEHLQTGASVYNLGTGNGTSVLELIAATEKAANKKIPYEILSRRPGDIASCYCDPSKAEQELSWKATRSIEEACEDSWRWQSQNPNGYTEKSVS
ncbi:MAG TPA: UDP-glucose 4-epimerase GalE [Candidatus Saccharimonadales bacterium]